MSVTRYDVSVLLPRTILPKFDCKGLGKAKRGAGVNKYFRKVDKPAYGGVSKYCNNDLAAHSAESAFRPWNVRPVSLYLPAGIY